MTKKHTMHVTMPRDKALEYLESLEKLVNDQFADMGYVVALGMAVREFRAAEPDNAPLTLEQLRGMNGEPVWCAELECHGIIAVDSNGRWESVPFLRGRWEQANFEYDIASRGLTIYRRPPEKEV